jgi:hypothetical protein
VDRARKWRFVFAAVLAGSLLAGCLATPIGVVDPSLVGNWRGECELSLPVVFNPNQIPEDVERTRATVALAITIQEDATVTGAFGEATIEESVLKRNRGELGRSLNVATDYIIMDGYLSGPIVSGADESSRKAFSIPFNVVDEHMRGSLFWRQDRKYPFPLCVRLELERLP